MFFESWCSDTVGVNMHNPNEDPIVNEEIFKILCLHVLQEQHYSGLKCFCYGQRGF